MFIPLLLMGGIIGRLFREFAMTVSIAVVVSAVVSLTLTPMMCSRFLRHQTAAQTASIQSIEGSSTGLIGGYRRRSTLRCATSFVTLMMFLATVC